MLLLDEPLGALDLKLRKGLQIELKRIQRDVGITFVYVTHDQEEALTMSDRIAVMNRGRGRAGRAPGGGLRAARDHVRRRLHRRLEPDARRRSPPPQGAGQVRLDSGVEVEAAVDGFAAGERCHAVVRPEKLQIDRAEEPATRLDAQRRGPGRELGLPGHVDPDRRRSSSGEVPLTVLVPNAERGGARAAAGRRRAG